MTTNIFDMTDTWNNGASTFYAIKMNVNNAGSAVDSKLIDLQLGGATVFNVGLTGTYVNGSVRVGGKNIAQISGSAAGQQAVFYQADEASADAIVNVGIYPKGSGASLLYSNDALQAIAAGPVGTSRYLILNGSVSGNPQLLAGGGGVVEIPNGFLSGAPTATSPLDNDNSIRIATTDFVKRQQYVQAAPPTTSDQLAGFANPPSGTLIEGIDMPEFGLKKIGPVLALTDDLGALEALDGVHTIYYRSGTSNWTPVQMGPSMSFTGDTLDLAAGAGGVVDAEYIVGVSHTGLSAERVLTNTATITWDLSTPGQAKANSSAGGGNVSSTGTPLATQFAVWSGSTTITGVTQAAALTAIGAQPLDPELSAIAGLVSSADQAPYFTGAGTAALMLVSPFMRTVLDDTNAPLAVATLGAAPLDSPNFLGQPTAPPPPGADSSIRLATTSFVKGQGYQTSADVTTLIAAQAQPLDPDLTSLAAATGTNTIYYRSAIGWQAVVVGANLTFTGGTLAGTAAGGGGNVNSVPTPSNTDLAQWTGATTIKGLPLVTHRTNATFYGVTSIRTASGAPAGGLDINPAAGNLLMGAAGTDPDINVALSSKGNGSFSIYNSGFARLAAQFNSAPGGNTFPTFTGNVGFSGLASNPPSNPIVMGSPLHATTMPVGDNTINVATTAFVQASKTAFVAVNDGTVTTGSVAYSPAAGNYHYYTNNGAHQIPVPSVDCAVEILVTNGATAGLITLAGFAVGANTGDALTTTNGHRFIISIRRINGISTYTVKALQ